MFKITADCDKEDAVSKVTLLLIGVTVRYRSLIVLGTHVKSKGIFALFLIRRVLSHTKRPKQKFTAVIAQAALLFPG